MGDLISRQALQDAMYHEAFETDSDMQKWDSGCWIRYKMFENVVEALPSAQPEPIKGKWLERSVDVDGKKSIEEWQSAKCSVCGRYHTTPFLYYFDDFNFCPNCGANMEGRE